MRRKKLERARYGVAVIWLWRLGVALTNHPEDSLVALTNHPKVK